MKFKNLVSAVSALAVAGSVFAGLAVTAGAAEKNTMYDFSQSSPAAPTTSRWSVSTGTDPVVGENTVGIYKAASNSGNGSGAYVYYDLADLIPADATAYTVSYKLYFPYENNSRIAVGLADITNYTFARYGHDTSRMIGSAGHFANEAFIRATQDGNRSFISDWQNNNHWVTVTDTINLVDNTYSTSIEGDATHSTNGSLGGDITKPDKLLIYGYSTDGKEHELVYLDDITVKATYPDPGAATNIVLSFKAAGEEVATQDINIADQGIIGGQTASYYIPAYVEGKNGNLYKVDGSNYSKTSNVATGTTYVDVAVTLATSAVHQFVECDGTDTTLSRENYYSNGSIMGLSAEGTPVLTVAKDGIYTVTIVTGGKEGTGRTGSAFVNSADNTLGSVAFSGYPQTATFTNVTLKENDVINVVAGRGSTSCVDYVIIEKTGDLPVEPTTVEAENLGAFNGTDESVATAFKAEMGEVTGTVTAAVTSAGKTNNFGGITLENANVILGIIVTGLNDGTAKATITVE